MNEVEYYGKEKSKEIVSNISHSLKQIDKKISELDESKRKTNDIIKKMEIECFEYNLVEEMSSSKSRLEQDIRAVLNKLNLINKKNVDSVYTATGMVDYINDILDSSNIQLKNVDKESIADIEQLQMNAIKKGIYDKYMLIKSDIDRDIIKRKFEKIQQKNCIKRFFDRFFDREDVDDRKKENLFMQIQEIDKVRNDIIENKEPKKDYKILEIVADIDIYLSDNHLGKKYKSQVSQIREIRNNICSTFTIDNEELKKEIAKQRQERLPVKIDKKINKMIRDRQKAIAFLTKNGYIKNNHEDDSAAVTSGMRNIIRKINIISDSIERILKV